MSRRALIAAATLLAALLWACAPAAPPTPAPTPTATPTLDEYVAALCVFQDDMYLAAIVADFWREIHPAFTRQVERLERLEPPPGWEEYHVVALERWRTMERLMREKRAELVNYEYGHYREIIHDAPRNRILYATQRELLSEEDRARYRRVCFGREE